MQPDKEELTIEEFLESLRAERETRPVFAATSVAPAVPEIRAEVEAMAAPVETVMVEASHGDAEIEVAPAVPEVPAEVAAVAARAETVTAPEPVAVSTPGAAPPCADIPVAGGTASTPGAAPPCADIPVAGETASTSGAERVIVRRQAPTSLSAAAPLPILAQRRVDRAKPKRSRRRGRSSLAARVIMGMGLLILVSQPAGSVSLWGNNSGSIFTQPVRNFKNGDIITIVVNEATTAGQQWTWEREKEWQVGATASDPGACAGKKNLFARFFPFMGLDYNSEYSTDNRSDRSTNFRATVSAEVVNVMPNGNLQIVARKVIRVNSEEQLIELTGNIRPLDISPGNTISSNAIADANIKVNGTLRYTNDAKPSPLERIFSFISGLFL
jgi:flagellar L-ring protein FlgH